MKTKLLLYFIALLTLNITLVSGDRSRIGENRNIRMQDASTEKTCIPYNTNPQSVVFVAQLAEGFEADSVSVGPEINTLISGFYDYKTNGETNIYIQVDPVNPQIIHVIDVIADTSDPTGQTTRRVKYSYSTNGGVSWDFNINVPDVRAGYGVLHLNSSGAAVIANHGNSIGNSLNANLYIDVAPLAGGFVEYGHPSIAPTGIWPQIAVLSNGNITMLSRRLLSGGNGLETLFVSTYNGTSLGAMTPFFFNTGVFQPNQTVGTNTRFHIATNGSGRVTAIIAPVLQDDTLHNSKIYQRTSVDDGANWGPLQDVFVPYTINGGLDTVTTVGGSGFIYKKNSDRWFLAYPISTNNDLDSTKLMITRSDGMTSMITSANQVDACSEYASNMNFVWNIDFAAMGFSADGSTLYCAYSVVTPNVVNLYNSRDIYCSYSLDDGSTWSNPIRITNTPDIDETYPSVSAWNSGSPGNAYELNITYMKDPGVGPTSYGGSAAASRNTLIYRKLTGLPPIGIINNQNLLMDYHLTQNYPNPFNPSTRIEYNIIKSGMVTLKVFDIVGREVKTLVNEVQTAGAKEIEFNASGLSSGIYFYTIISGDFTDTKKMILLK